MIRTAILCLVVVGFCAVGATAQVSRDQQAEMAINAARKVYNDGNLPAAADQFKNVLEKFGNTNQATAARFGLSLCLTTRSEPDYPAALEAIGPGVNDGGFAERGALLYQVALCHRAIGIRDADKALATPAEAAKFRKTADENFQQAARWYNEASNWFDQKKDEAWSGRSRCDKAEAELRWGRFKDARTTTEPFTKDAAFAKNPARMLGLYYHGLACLQDRDTAAAGKTLNQLAPFEQPGFGTHARYLVGRILHQSGETAEASVHYDAVIEQFAKDKAAAVEAIKNPDQFKGNPIEFKRLETLAKGTPPDAVAGATFHSSTLAYEAGKFADALTRLQVFTKDFATSPLVPDAMLRIGFCQVQLKQYDDATKTLAPLVVKYPAFADQTQLWLGKAHVGLASVADANNPADREGKLKTAVEAFKKSAEFAQKLANEQAPDGRTRRGEALMELGDTLHLLKQHTPAAQTFEQIWNEQLLPERRREEVLQRLAAAYQLAGDANRSDQYCEEFKNRYKQSILMPAVVFCSAENAYLRALDVAKSNDTNRLPERKARFEDATRKYQEVVDRFPEFERVNYARFGIGVCLSQNGDLLGTTKILEAIPAPERNGELSAANYLLADCLIRLAPTQAEDALAENIIREKLTAASGLLENYVASNPKATDAPDALLKLGLCLKRLGSTLADANERNTLLNKAREFNEKLTKDYPTAPQVGHARLEMAKIKAMMGDKGGAINDLRQFAGGELQKSPMAPLALIQLGTALREQNQSAEAVKVLEEARKTHEEALKNDKDRAEWLPLLKYQHGLALMETDKLPEAQKVFDDIFNSTRGKPISAEAALRSGQVGIALGRKTYERGRMEKFKPNQKPDQVAAGDRVMADGKTQILRAAEQMERRSEELRQALPAAESRARMFYDAAWAYRPLAEEEIVQARKDRREQEVRAWTENLAKNPNAKPGTPPTDAIPLSKLAMQGCEDRTQNAYKRLIDEFSDLAIAIDARLELAELRTDRDDRETAIKLLRDALDKEPTDKAVSPELLERIRLKLGANLFAKKDYKGARTQFQTVAGNTKSALHGQAMYRQAEAMIALDDHAGAIEKLIIYRDNGQYHQIAEVSDRALLRLGQCYATTKNWEASRATLQTMLERYGNSPFVPEARYGLGWALQNQQKYDDAINQYQIVVGLTTAEVAARAQMQIGLCHLSQKRYPEATTALLIVPYTYDYPELGYAAILEAARAFDENKQPRRAEPLLQKLLKDAPPESVWAKAAKTRLENPPK